MSHRIGLLLLLLGLLACSDPPAGEPFHIPDPAPPPAPAPRNPGKLAHVVVALCDNRYQGIVPVPERLGNGDDPASNLYWGAAYGVKTFFVRSGDWTLLSTTKDPKPGVLERCVFRHKSRPAHLVADAYRGREIQRATLDFLRFAAGRDAEPFGTGALHAGGAADLVAYVGHDGLMDFSLSEHPAALDDRGRSAVILACASKPYFQEPLRRTGALPLLWTNGLMAPEAYVLDAALAGWMLGEDGAQVRKRAAEAYHRYQKCGMNAAMRLFATGW